MEDRRNIWIEEYYTSEMCTHICLRVKDYVYRAQSEFQTVDVVDTHDWGRVMFLDSVVMVCDKYEFIYHEMISHPLLFSHPSPKRILIIGGGDGGAAREALKHPGVTVDMVEIDGMVVDVARKYFPGCACSFDNPRLNLVIGDGVEFVKGKKDEYDIIVVDSTDPIGPAVGLFEEDFYRCINAALKPEGFFAFQSESPYYYSDFQKQVIGKLRKIFPLVKPYTATIPMYPGSFWTFTVGSRKFDPFEIRRRMPLADFSLKYYNYEIHEAAFALPEFAKKIFCQEGA
ncbi:MAG: polyamine aminopropyltransferase [Candidatus Wallbacteria bacterium]|nr:polyamine aminopropyltransferase [Candidatus Wallbacteria bacterium]